MKKLELFILFAIVIVAFVLRLYKIQRPLADWHSWRQADTAAVARNFVEEGFNPFVPKYDDMSSQSNGLDNPKRYRFVEFPIFNLLVALAWKVFGVSVMSARLVTVFISIGSTIFLYLLVREFSNVKIAVLSAFFFATIPYNVFYSSTILPGPFMVFATLGLYFFFTKWLQNQKWHYFLLSILFANLAILSWPIALFFMFPIVYLAFEKYKAKMLIQPRLWALALFSIAPFIAWRIWIMRFPEGIPNWQLLINEGSIRFKGAFFRWLLVERMGKLILTIGGFALFILGIIAKNVSREKLFYYAYLASVALYFIVFASGNVRHDYYQIPLIPIVSIFMAKGTDFLLNLPSSTFNRFVGSMVAVSLILMIYAFGFFEVRGFYWINKPQIVKAGIAVDRLLPKDATVIAPYNGDAAFLYQTNRHGYPIVDRPLETFIEEGTKYLVSVDVNDAGIQNLAKHCRVVEQTPDYVIVEMSTGCIGK